MSKDTYVAYVAKAVFVHKSALPLIWNPTLGSSRNSLTLDLPDVASAPFGGFLVLSLRPFLSLPSNGCSENKCTPCLLVRKADESSHVVYPSLICRS